LLGFLQQSRLRCLGRWRVLARRCTAMRWARLHRDSRPTQLGCIPASRWRPGRPDWQCTQRGGHHRCCCWLLGARKCCTPLRKACRCAAGRSAQPCRSMACLRISGKGESRLCQGSALLLLRSCKTRTSGHLGCWGSLCSQRWLGCCSEPGPGGRVCPACPVGSATACGQ